MKKRMFHVALVALLSLLATSSAWAQPPAQTYVFNSREAYSDVNPGDGVWAAVDGQRTLVAANVVPVSTAGKILLKPLANSTDLLLR